MKAVVRRHGLGVGPAIDSGLEQCRDSRPRLSSSVKLSLLLLSS
jgi:hypothetical protein